MNRWGRAVFRSCLFCCALWTMGAISVPGVGATITVHFDQDVYFVNGPGESFDARVLIDGNEVLAEDNPVRGGLFSFAVETTYPAAKAELGDLSKIVVVPELDQFGFDTSAFRRQAPGTAAAKGNIDSTTLPLTPYDGVHLATFQFTNLATGPDSYPLGLDFFRTVGVNEQLFLNGGGDILDGMISFRPARVVVLPEPSGWLLVACGVGGILPIRRRG